MKRKIGVFLIILSVVTLAVVALRIVINNAPQDSTGRTPEQTVVAFLELARQEKFDEAKSMWIVDGKYTFSEPTDFPTYCRMISYLTEDDVRYTSRGKSGWWHVYFKREAIDEKNVHMGGGHLSLIERDGRYLINRGGQW